MSSTEVTNLSSKSSNAHAKPTETQRLANSNRHADKHTSTRGITRHTLNRIPRTLFTPCAHPANPPTKANSCAHRFLLKWWIWNHVALLRSGGLPEATDRSLMVCGFGASMSARNVSVMTAISRHCASMTAMRGGFKQVTLCMHFLYSALRLSGVCIFSLRSLLTACKLCLGILRRSGKTNGSSSPMADVREIVPIL